jgi:glycosyltransferase involved in cell wall biosynthesis
LYVDPKDEKELQQAINTLFFESEERRSLRIKEGISYVQKFNDDVIVAQWEKLYQSVTHG